MRRADCRVRTLGRRLGIWRCRKEAFVAGERIRERERAVLWRLVLRSALSCGRWVGREWYVGVDSKRAISRLERELEGRESFAVRRMTSSMSSSGNSAAFLGGAG